MKLVRGIVREERLDDVLRVLDARSVPGMTVSRAAGRGQTPLMGSYRGRPYPVLMPVCVIDIIVGDNQADDVARLLVDCTHTGERGDGLVIVMPLDSCCAVRTRWLEVA